MLKTEAQLEAEIAALLRKAELIDAQEDARYGKGKRGDELPKSSLKNPTTSARMAQLPNR
jgi:hypothetical protein